MQMRLLGLVLGVLSLWEAAAVAAPARPFTAKDMWSMQRLSSPRLSPTGNRLVFVVNTPDLEANRGRSDLWLLSTDGLESRPLTTHPDNDVDPQWSPDGRFVYFASPRSGSMQVWRVAVDGGEAAQVTRLPLDVGSFQLSPDGKTLLVSMAIFVDCAKGVATARDAAMGKDSAAAKDKAAPPKSDLACTVDRLAAQAKERSTGRLHTRLFARHWDEWNDGRRSHLFSLKLSGTNGLPDGAEPIDLMKGMDADCPTKPFGGAEDYAFSPDGVHIVFSAKDAPTSDEAWSTNFDLWLASPDGKLLKNVSAGNKAWDARPQFSPDGKWLAYLAMSRPGYESDRFRIVLRSIPSVGPDRELAAKWDRSPQDYTWSKDAQTIYATADNLGQASLFAIDVGTGQAREIVKDGTMASPVAGKDRVFFLKDDLNNPAELFSTRLDGGELKQLTRFNAERLKEVAMGEPVQFAFKGAGGDTVYAWLLKPVGLSPGKKVPVAMLIHGGPQGSFGNHFHYRWNPQAYAGAGYAALMIDFHGSTGYGQAFTDAIRGDWGGKPLEDLKLGLAAALEKFSFLDGKRVAALGASYGAYMVNWIAGAWPDRFKCLVSHDGNLDEQFAYFDTEELWFPEWEHNGTPWDNPESYQKHNPINLVKNWKTPMLVIHGGKDYRVVETQGLATFTAAQRRGIPSQFLYFPDENHWILKPHNSLHWHKAVLEWLDQWTK